jgi:transposase
MFITPKNEKMLTQKGASIQKKAIKVYVASRKHKIVYFKTYKVEPNL